VCAALGEAYPQRESAYRARMQSIESRMVKLSDEIAAAVQGAGLAGAPVVASGHQATFCAAVGLEVVATYTGSNTQKLSQLQRCIGKGERAGVRCVVATLQEGPQLAEPLAHRLGARTVVFSNFPSMEEGQRTFDALVRANVAALVGESSP
jgi:ABC-type Zn uptake system ZnuABC Zn-binding protein ZnuA